jgi:beta-N-acetylhexosaminidase
MYEQLKLAPFNLDDTAIKWIKDKFDAMDLNARVSHLFNLMVMDNSPETLEAVAAFQPGGITKIIGSDLHAECQILNDIRDRLTLPPLISGDLEGGSMSLMFGTQLPNQLGLAALNDPKKAEKAVEIIAREASLLGINWSFTPVVDVDDSFRSANVGTRSYGSDVKTITELALGNIRAFQSNNIAATAKHWPGDGQDDRDQHLVTSVNPLAMTQWREKYGTIYQNMIDAGVLSIMSAHIALPEYMKGLTDNREEWYRPASLNKHLNVDLLRGELGFNGLIISDATLMAGASSWADRTTVLAETIENGCDMILFCRQPAEDFALMMAAVRKGKVSEQRLNESVIRILALKAAIGLHQSFGKRSDVKQLRQPDDVAFASELIRKTPTLVKERITTLPLSVKKHKRILVFSTGIHHSFIPQPIPLEVPKMLAQQGFDITVFSAEMMIDYRDYDCVLYLLADESSLLKSRIYIDWMKLAGGVTGAMERHWNTLPAVMVSFGYPYHLYDAPRVPVYINAYCALPEVQQAIVDGLLGKLAFNDLSPVDAFCGLEQLRY